MDSPDSPRSEKSQTRFSTPVSDLDDHRHHKSTRPRGDTIGSPQSPRSPLEGRHTYQNVGSSGRPELLQVNGELLNGGSISRDFEQAIIDDDKSGNGENIIERRGSFNPATSRRGTVRKSQNHPSRSRESSISSRSTSPANSVDAFADPRRRERANTVGSRAPSDLELGLQRTVSGGTHRRSRRPTFNSGSVRNLSLKDERISVHNTVEDDVCFPTADESTKTYNIDFEELDEFVAETRSKAHNGHGLKQKLSFSSQGNKPQIFLDARYAAVPKIISQSSSSLKVGSESAIDDGDTAINNQDGADEKAGDPLGANGPTCRQHSLAGPSRYSFFSSELESTIHAEEFADLISPGDTSRDLFELPVNSGVWWLDILNPTQDELHVFQRAFGIHRLTTEDIITQEAREKVELFKQYYFVCFRSFFQMDVHSEDYMDPLNVYMVVFREGIITITYTQSPHAANVRKRIGKLRDYMALTADWICYALIDNIVDTFGPPIHTIEREADVIEDQVFVARTEDYTPLLRQVGQCRKKVMSLMRLLGGKADVIKGFAKRCNEQYSVTPRGEIGLYLGDIQDHVVTMMSNLGHFEKMLSRSQSNYLAQVSVAGIAQSTRSNEVLSKITLAATILVPLNLICGLFGMNVPVPGKNSEGLGWFFGIIGVIFAIVVVSLGIAKKYKFF
ncbi:Mg(2+) transporter [Imshaugia aleurites]|uniref:Mg(2+) transporter n=1 Tax=Imshaugia aleurites TaxID=172621 RepID=A0A8H3EFG8_9LECA|nr:Mg(2+) transporter [Imshaugia aleurites]